VATTRYRPHPMLALEEKALAALAEETGRTFDQWVALARRKGPKDRAALKAWLKEQGLRQMRVHWIAGASLSGDDLGHEDPEPLVDRLYSGTKAALRPLHEKVVDVMLAQGRDVIVTACKTMVPVYRKHVFAEMRPVDGAVEVLLALGDGADDERLRPASRQPGDRLTHAVRVRSAKDLDAAFRKWVTAAYANGSKAMTRSAGDVEPPPDLARALKASAEARRTWAQCTPAMKRDLIAWITSAKKDETRAQRVVRTHEALAAGKRRVY
jgi:hypothetical protein